MPLSYPDSSDVFAIVTFGGGFKMVLIKNNNNGSYTGPVKLSRVIGQVSSAFDGATPGGVFSGALAGVSTWGGITPEINAVLQSTLFLAGAFTLLFGF
jgi:hypothetical protein